MTRTLGWQGIFSALSAVALAVPAAAWGQSPAERLPLILHRAGDRLVLALDEERQAGDPEYRLRVAVNTDLLSEYWLGIALGRLPDVAKEQLGVEGGVVVADVVENSPAAKAEFKKHDILIKAGDVALNEPADLLKVVEDSKGKELTIRVLRGGKERTIAVTPEKRPEDQDRTATARVETLIPKSALREESIKVLEEAIRNMKEKTGEGALGLWFPKPAVVAPKGEGWAALEVVRDFRGEFPKDLTVRIAKEGDRPAKVHVKRGDNEWEVAEDKLSELPDDVRPHVQKLLGRMLAPGVSAAANRILRVQPGGKVEGEIKIAPVPPMPPKPPKAGVPPTSPVPPQVARLHAYRVEQGGVEAKLDAIMKKLDQLSREVAELQDRSESDADKK